jgi:hypothetical protein
MERILVTTDEFNGRYVAMKSVNDNTIVGVGEDPEKALRDAESKGFKILSYYTCPKGMLCRSTLCLNQSSVTTGSTDVTKTH